METKRRATVIAAVLLTGLTGYGFAQTATDPHPGPSQPVREQNLDASGAIRVHETGTANVNVTNGSLTVTGTVSVGNSSLGVNVLGGSLDANITGGSVTAKVSPASGAYYRAFVTPVGEFESDSFATINASAIHAHSSTDSKIHVRFLSPLGGSTGLISLGTTGDALLTKGEVITFPQPLPINGVWVNCGNISTDCSVEVAVIGTAATP